MKIILLCGKAQSGKDTSANFMVTYLSQKNKTSVIMHYADILKFICKEYCGWDGQKDIVGRSILQDVGTNVIRKRDPDFLVQCLVRIIDDLSEAMGWDFVIIPDCRFPNEIETISLKYDCTAVKIERSLFDNGLSNDQKNHPSETALDDYLFDHTIINDTGLDDLKKLCEKFIDDVLEG